MRLDKFLKVSRIIKRRTVANEVCSAGRVSVNGKQAKPSTVLNTGDVLQIGFGEHQRRYEVVSLNEKVQKGEAPLMYKEV
ncbi:MAG: RNA-binding S4 domain-containing protein [Christensenellales bacterium]